MCACHAPAAAAAATGGLAAAVTHPLLLFGVPTAQGYSEYQLSNLVQIWPGTKDKKTRLRLAKIVDDHFGL